MLAQRLSLVRLAIAALFAFLIGGFTELSLVLFVEPASLSPMHIFVSSVLNLALIVFHSYLLLANSEKRLPIWKIRNAQFFKGTFWFISFKHNVPFDSSDPISFAGTLYENKLFVS